MPEKRSRFRIRLIPLLHIKRLRQAVLFFALAGAGITDVEAKAPDPFIAGMGTMQIIQRMQLQPMTFYRCTERSPNGFVNREDEYYVQGDLGKGYKAIFLGPAKNTILDFGDVFVFRTVDELKEGVSDPRQIATLNITATRDPHTIGIELTTARETNEAQCTLDAEQTQQSAESYRYQNPPHG